jgi:hypothetical protein
MTVPPHPTLSLWQPIEVNVIGIALLILLKQQLWKLSTSFAINVLRKLQDIISGYFLQWILVTQNGLSG